MSKYVIWHPGANHTIVSYNASDVKIYNATSSILKTKTFSPNQKSDLAFLLPRRCCSCNFRSRRIGPRSQFYDRELQRHEKRVRFEKKTILFYFEKTL
jgi:hypothetical protein